MSKFCDSNLVGGGAAPMQSWRARCETPENEKWPTSQWFRKYHANCKTEQWQFKEIKKYNDAIRECKQLEQASCCSVWQSIRKSEPVAAIEEYNSFVSMKPRAVKNQNNGTRGTRISSSFDVIHRIHELNGLHQRDEHNWRISKVATTNIDEKKSAL